MLQQLVTLKMVKKLFLVRHAQASETEQGSKDFDRFLTRNGQREAVHAGLFLKRHDKKPDLIVASNARRALATATIIAEQLDYPVEEILEEPEMYEASVRILLRIINELDVNCQQVMLVGHNPGLSYLAELLTDDLVGNMLPGSLAEIHFSGDSWKEVSQRTGSLVLYKSPQEMEAEEHES